MPGGSCAGANLCDVDGQCDFGNDTCTALPAAGSPCLFGNCAPGHFCDGSTCTLLRIAGAACASSGQCEDPLICAGAPGVKTCRVRQFDACS
jgi:hypothetical protein